ncbi:IQ calmodulin-binding motif family protein [Trichomonas vaginalis G3]|uniref:IQ calmodulin-binding motif family protein n=1 Tax=Trichomonas vaginalis (strain ATCC PRA-98 / G3) TaxID=412133 RepID=A2DGQ7_TRIV3|nr:hypothetical protein TVAGG3_0997470 [Trichomonas vaginalis G3]EAY20444.1 IQ calmodulin-binding motif family protein [Trichomonas vaginalis G3]KAI5490506.1 hypothetical protein TVAGG3_0997470 [Trichomonas vaginalis G3]|eukprot:XP_001581430.1 IQ calmodulin-binding motif family protein [Trichomonas vaginalis G3]
MRGAQKQDLLKQNTMDGLIAATSTHGFMIFEISKKTYRLEELFERNMKRSLFISMAKQLINRERHQNLISNQKLLHNLNIYNLLLQKSIFDYWRQRRKWILFTRKIKTNVQLKIFQLARLQLPKIYREIYRSNWASLSLELLRHTRIQKCQDLHDSRANKLILQKYIHQWHENAVTSAQNKASIILKWEELYKKLHKRQIKSNFRLKAYENEQRRKWKLLINGKKVSKILLVYNQFVTKQNWKYFARQLAFQQRLNAVKAAHDRLERIKKWKELSHKYKSNLQTQTLIKESNHIKYKRLFKYFIRETLHNEKLNDLRLAKDKINEIREKRSNKELQRNMLYLWNERAMIHRVTMTKLKSSFNKAYNIIARSAKNRAAEMIQKSFRSYMIRRESNLSLLQKMFMGWRHLIPNITDRLVSDFPDMILILEKPKILEFNVKIPDTNKLSVFKEMSTVLRTEKEILLDEIANDSTKLIKFSFDPNLKQHKVLENLMNYYQNKNDIISSFANSISTLININLSDNFANQVSISHLNDINKIETKLFVDDIQMYNFDPKLNDIKLENTPLEFFYQANPSYEDDINFVALNATKSFANVNKNFQKETKSILPFYKKISIPLNVSFTKHYSNMLSLDMNLKYTALPSFKPIKCLTFEKIPKQDVNDDFTYDATSHINLSLDFAKRIDMKPINSFSIEEIELCPDDIPEEAASKINFDSVFNSLLSTKFINISPTPILPTPEFPEEFFDEMIEDSINSICYTKMDPLYDLHFSKFQKQQIDDDFYVDLPLFIPEYLVPLHKSLSFLAQNQIPSPDFDEISNDYSNNLTLSLSDTKIDLQQIFNVCKEMRDRIEDESMIISQKYLLNINDVVSNYVTNNFTKLISISNLFSTKIPKQKLENIYSIQDTCLNNAIQDRNSLNWYVKDKFIPIISENDEIYELPEFEPKFTMNLGFNSISDRKDLNNLYEDQVNSIMHDIKDLDYCYLQLNNSNLASFTFFDFFQLFNLEQIDLQLSLDAMEEEKNVLNNISHPENPHQHPNDKEELYDLELEFNLAEDQFNLQNFENHGFEFYEDMIQELKYPLEFNLYDITNLKYQEFNIQRIDLIHENDLEFINHYDIEKDLSDLLHFINANELIHLQFSKSKEIEFPSYDIELDLKDVDIPIRSDFIGTKEIPKQDYPSYDIDVSLKHVSQTTANPIFALSNDKYFNFDNPEIDLQINLEEVIKVDINSLNSISKVETYQILTPSFDVNLNYHLDDFIANTLDLFEKIAIPYQQVSVEILPDFNNIANILSIKNLFELKSVEIPEINPDTDYEIKFDLDLISIPKFAENEIILLEKSDEIDNYSIKLNFNNLKSNIIRPLTFFTNQAIPEIDFPNYSIELPEIDIKLPYLSYTKEIVKLQEIPENIFDIKLSHLAIPFNRHQGNIINFELNKIKPQEINDVYNLELTFGNEIAFIKEFPFVHDYIPKRNKYFIKYNVTMPSFDFIGIPKFTFEFYPKSKDILSLLDEKALSELSFQFNIDDLHQKNQSLIIYEKSKIKENHINYDDLYEFNDPKLMQRLNNAFEVLQPKQIPEFSVNSNVYSLRLIKLGVNLRRVLRPLNNMKIFGFSEWKDIIPKFENSFDEFIIDNVNDIIEKAIKDITLPEKEDQLQEEESTPNIIIPINDEESVFDIYAALESSSPTAAQNKFNKEEDEEESLISQVDIINDELYEAEEENYSLHMDENKSRDISYVSEEESLNITEDEIIKEEEDFNSEIDSLLDTSNLNDTTYDDSNYLNVTGDHINVSSPNISNSLLLQDDNDSMNAESDESPIYVINQSNEAKTEDKTKSESEEDFSLHTIENENKESSLHFEEDEESLPIDDKDNEKIEKEYGELSSILDFDEDDKAKPDEESLNKFAEESIESIDGLSSIDFDNTLEPKSSFIDQAISDIFSNSEVSKSKPDFVFESDDETQEASQKESPVKQKKGNKVNETDDSIFSFIKSEVEYVSHLEEEEEDQIEEGEIREFDPNESLEQLNSPSLLTNDIQADNLLKEIVEDCINEFYNNLDNTLLNPSTTYLNRSFTMELSRLCRVSVVRRLEEIQFRERDEKRVNWNLNF